MSYVTEEAVKNVLDELVITREKRRRIQGMNAKELGAYIVDIYRQGFESGAQAIEKAMQQEAESRNADPESEYKEVKADWDDVLRIISEVKGVGPKLTAAIDQRMKEAMG